jgi:hypothetical protein
MTRTQTPTPTTSSNNCCSPTISSISNNTTTCQATINITYPTPPCSNCAGIIVEVSTTGPSGPWSSITAGGCLTSRTIGMTSLSGVTHIRLQMQCSGGGTSFSPPFAYSVPPSCINQKIVTNTSWYIVNNFSNACNPIACGSIGNVSINGNGLSPLTLIPNGCVVGTQNCVNFPLLSGQEGRKDNLSFTSKGNGKFDVQLQVNKTSGYCLYAYLRVGDTFGYVPANTVEYTNCMSTFNLTPVLNFTDVDIDSNQFVTIVITCNQVGSCSCSNFNTC